MKNYAQITRNSSQREPIFGRESEMTQNNAGGYTFTLSPLDTLRRFLILGSEGGTYYVDERTLTKDNAKNALEVLESQPEQALNLVIEVSQKGLAPKNDPAIFALALGASCRNAWTRRLALQALPLVCRTGTHILQFVSMVNELRGWGRGLRTGIGKWYTEKKVEDLAYQVMKYGNRAGFTHRDVLRLTHAYGGEVSTARGALFRAIAHPEFSVGDFPELEAFKMAKSLNDSTPVAKVIDAIKTYNLPREVIPTKFLNEPKVWEALFDCMPFTAMIRNLGKMTSIGVISPMSDTARAVVTRLNDVAQIERSRIHPIMLLNALNTYSSGHGFKGSLRWNPEPNIVRALEEAFYLSFGTVEPSGKNTLLALDVSGSMGASTIGGLNDMLASEAAAVMAMVTARRESSHLIRGFSTEFKDLGITSNMSLSEVRNITSRQAFGRTDCAIPMIWATKERVPVDTFIVYTDNETWAGQVHPAEALKNYRQKMGIGAKLVVVGMTSTGFTIADPQDAGMLDVVGFDATAPNVITEFSKGAV